MSAINKVWLDMTKQTKVRQQAEKPLSDAQLLRWLRDHMYLNDQGSWLSSSPVPYLLRPTMKEFRAALSELARKK